MYFPCRYDLHFMNFTKRWEEFSATQNFFNIIERKVIVHERNIIKEILWMLSGVKDVFILQWNGSEFLPNSQIHSCELTSKSLGNILKEFCEYGTKVAVLRDFVNDVQLRNSDVGKNCHIFQAYTEAVKEQVQHVTNQISDLDKILRDKRKIFTLLVLRKEIKPILDAIDLIYFIHQETTGTICTTDDPFGRMCKILQVLWELLCHQSLREQMSSMLLKIILTVFLRTSTPLFSFLEELMFLG
ncbi:Gamma-tubulin complex component 5, partial [Stegodyphus mimosarum]